MGAVLIWFGTAELWSPSDWSVFVPGILAPLDPGLLAIHAALLLLAGISLVVGVRTGAAAALGALLLAGVLGALGLNGRLDSVFVRDVGLLGALIGLAQAHPLVDETPRRRLAVVVALTAAVALACGYHGFHAPGAVRFSDAPATIGSLSTLGG